MGTCKTNCCQGESKQQTVNVDELGDNNAPLIEKKIEGSNNNINNNSSIIFNDNTSSYCNKSNGGNVILNDYINSKIL